MNKLLMFMLMAVTMAAGQEFKQAKLLDVQPFKQQGAPIIAPNNGSPVVIQTSYDMFTVTVAIDGMSYSAPYHQTRHFKAADLIVGDTIPARLDGEKLILKSSDGKEMKAKITRKARLTSN